MGPDEPVRSTADDLTVEVVYCPGPGAVDQTSLVVAAGALLGDALRASGLFQRHAALDEASRQGQLRCGVWGRLRPADFSLRDGDRVEVYRPLQVDPMEARRKRQKVQRAVPGR